MTFWSISDRLEHILPSHVTWVWFSSPRVIDAFKSESYLANDKTSGIQNSFLSGNTKDLSKTVSLLDASLRESRLPIPTSWTN
jgi:hypothetical protein